MSFYLLIYIVSIVFSIYWGYLVYKIYKNAFGIFFLLFTIFMSGWFILFFLFFSGISGVENLLFISRFCFWIWVLTTYSLLFSLYFFNIWKNNLSKKSYLFIILFFISILWIYIGSDRIIYDLEFSQSENVYREIPGKWFLLHVFFQSFFVVAFVIMAFIKWKQSSYINRLRLKYISFFSYLLLFLLITFQLFLPMMWIRIFEREIILIYTFFISWVVYVIKKYYFTNVYYSIWKIFIWFLAWILSLGSIFWLTQLYEYFNNGFWGNTNFTWYANIVIWIIFYVIFYKILYNFLLWRDQYSTFEWFINKLKQNISLITDFHKLCPYLEKELKSIFKTYYCKVSLFDNFSNKELKKFFQKNNWMKLFINDIVFIEENKSKFDKKNILLDLDNKDFLIFPIFNSQENIWIISLGIKSFWDFYNKTEIKIIQDFIFFIEHHLKYIQSFEKIRDFSLNLDKKVDEKTIEYNNLINKQKEFIAMISHEIRSPVASAIFQADSMLDDIKYGDISDIKSELEILNSILIKIWELTSKLFAVQYYDTHNVTLYLEEIHIPYLLKNEIEVHTHTSENIQFIDRVDKNIWFLKIDKVQFRQVIENLISNAIKFTQGKDGIVCVTWYKTDTSFIVKIEDNGEGFEWIKIWDLFDKYSKWNTNIIWLWMWLYLCKKIISMHQGNIHAGFSQEFWWAEFIIEIPII